MDYSINDTTGNGSVVDRPFESSPEWTKVILDIIFFIIGFTGNVCLVFIAIRYKSMRTVPNYLITNLALVDLIFICMFLPTEIVGSLRVDQLGFFKSFAHCSLYQYLKIVFLAVSIFTLTALSIDRYLAVSKPLACRMLRSGRRRLCAVLLGIAVIWSAAFVAAYPVLDLAVLWFDGHCRLKNFKKLFVQYTYASTAIFLLVPTVIISVSYCCTARNLLKTNHLLHGQNAVQVSARQRRQRQRLAIAVIVIVVVFVSTWSLSYGLDIVQTIDGGRLIGPPNSGSRYPAVLVLEYLRYLMIRINVVINPIILFIVSSSHRRHFKMACCCCLPGHRSNDRKHWLGLHKFASMTVQSTVDQQTRNSLSNNGRLTRDHQV